MKGKKRMIKIAIGLVAGGILGFLYYKIIGCSSGACPITSNPWSSTIYGAIMGLLIASI